MSGSLHAEVVLACGYAVFLAIVAAVLELLARHTHRRADQYHIAGFKYHQHLDAWECPAGQQLHRHHSHETRVRRYRAPARACNTCPLKPRCTDSVHGREITRTSFLWLESEVGRFHRGLSLALLVLAQFILAIELLRFNSRVELFLVGSLLAGLATLWAKLLVSFRGPVGTRG